MKASERDDLQEFLTSCSIEEVHLLRDQLRDGKIDGGYFWLGDCGCILGTIAHHRVGGDMSKTLFGDAITRMRVSSSRPLENGVSLIASGETPSNSKRAAELDLILSEFLLSNDVTATA